MTAKEQHVQNLRTLQARYRACEEAGNDAGCEAIQRRINEENKRFESQSNQNTKTK